MRLRDIGTKLSPVRWFRWLSIIAIAEKSPPEAVPPDGYEITLKQMDDRSYAVRKHLGYQVCRLERTISMLRGAR